MGFATRPATKDQAGLAAGAPAPTCQARWYGPLLYLFASDRALRNPPSGRFDDALSGVAGQAPTQAQVQAHVDRVMAWLTDIHHKHPVTVVWATSGRRSKAAPDPDFVRAWAELVGRLPDKTDALVAGLPAKLLATASRELPKAERDAVKALAKRRAHLAM